MTASPTPEYLVEVWRAHLRGQRERAKQIFFYNQVLTWFYPDSAIAVKKEVLVRRGVIHTALSKQPGSEFGELERRELAEVLSWVEENVAASAGVQPLRGGRRVAPRRAR
jgi:dihydrodipicolinate synthase/N-acetylneuraminate lyase